MYHAGLSEKAKNDAHHGFIQDKVSSVKPDDVSLKA